MTDRDRVLATFRREPLDRIVFQPRIRYWYTGRNQDGTMPEAYRGLTMLEVYDALGVSPRYSPEVLGLSPFGTRIDETVRTRHFDEGRNIVIHHETPIGTLREARHKTEQGSAGYPTEYPVKTPADMEVMGCILDHTEFYYDREAHHEAERLFGDRGIVQSYYPRSPYQRLIITYMGWENTFFALADHPAETERFMEAIARWDDSMYEVIIGSELPILNFGENIDAHIDPPNMYKKYLIPYYQRRVGELHDAGKLCHIHMDGALKPLLPLLGEVDFDGIEAATPVPQGDVTVEELRAAMGDTILLDGIPAVLFLPEHPVEDLIDCTRSLLAQFTPNLILGVSDELPPPADIDRVRLVQQMVEDYSLGG